MYDTHRMKSVNTLEDLLEGSKLYWSRQEIFHESGLDKRGINDGNPFWSGFEAIVFILLPNCLSRSHSLDQL
jgi:hypothetical protein